ncbi:glycosyltransferase [Pedobacter hartonius]|uniref:Glycosyltransferase, MGT family n=1 Tax=Pedobacter hartonius TaxID=425514 RepID=A0A1H4DZQ9_9SPHI|nr:glycosyltransferase [Pedobacter hartonius]SEA77672.1 glycosyltransferase, MGT family [Pedobacter hartonius]
MNIVKEQLKGKRILFATVPTDGHFNPLTGLAKYLQQVGCDIRWYTSVTFEDKLKRLEIPLYPFEKALEINQSNFLKLFPGRAGITDAAEVMEFDLHYLLGNMAGDLYTDILKIHESFPFDLMIADSSFTAIPLVKIKMNIPVVSIGVYPLPESAANLAPYSMGLPPAKNETELLNYAELHKEALNKTFKGSTDSFHSILEEHDIRLERSLLLDLLVKQASLYLQIGAPSFEYKRVGMGENIRFVGSLLPYSSNHQKKPWYDERLEQYEKVVLVTQGTVEKDPDKIIVPTLEAFYGTDTLVIATTAGNQTEKLKEKYAAKNIIIEDFIPYDDVMPYAGVYITNGGYGGVMLSISHKLPIVAAGLLEAKNEICSRIGYFKLGIDLSTERPSPQELRSAVEEVMVNGQYKNNATRLSIELDSYLPTALCASYVAELLQQPGQLKI